MPYWNTADDLKRLDISMDNRIGTDHCVITNGDTFSNKGFVAEPYIIPDVDICLLDQMFRQLGPCCSAEVMSI